MVTRCTNGRTQCNISKCGIKLLFVNSNVVRITVLVLLVYLLVSELVSLHQPVVPLVLRSQ